MSRVEFAMNSTRTRNFKGKLELNQLEEARLETRLESIDTIDLSRVSNRSALITVVSARQWSIHGVRRTDSVRHLLVVSEQQQSIVGGQ